MKKIFAIALALVMVFSMASAFALNDCFSGFDWSCPTSSTLCGKAKLEVVPYVKVNNGCGGFDWQVSDCATAIKTEKVFFAIKLTVDANVDPEWWAGINADSGVVVKGLAGGTWANLPNPLDGLDTIAPFDPDKFEYVDDDLKEDEVQVFYLTTAGAWIHEDDASFEWDTYDVIIDAEVTDSKKAEVCATLASDHDGFGAWEYGKYDVEVVGVASATDAGMLTIEGDCGAEFVMVWVDGEVVSITATSAAFLNEVKAVFNLTDCVVGTCVDDEIVQRNFGWDDEFESCFKWSDKGAAVVNPECVVAIPKTGDVSVVAYAVMAVVAAAGAMLKK